MARLLAAFLFGFAALAGCAATSVSEHATSSAPRTAVFGPHVPSGTAFTVRLSAAHSGAVRGGEHFEAYTEQSLRSPEGAVVIPAGSLVRGRLSWSARRSRWTVVDASVRSVVGPLDLRASVAGDVGANDDARPYSTDRARGSVPPSRHPSARAHDVSAADTSSAPLALRGEQSLRLVLSRPILAPGASVVPIR